MELLSITLTAGETKRFERAGRYFELIESSGPVRIDFYEASGRQSDQMVNAVSGLFLEDTYGAFVIYSPTAQTVQILVMETGRGGSRRQPGNVRVIDSSAEKTLAGKSYIGTIGISGTAGNQPIAGIRNNGTTPLAITNLNISSDTAALVSAISGSNIVAAGFLATDTVFNKLIGSPDLPVGQCDIFANSYATLGAFDAKFPSSKSRHSYLIQPAVQNEFDYSKSPFVLPPGSYLLFKALTNGANLNVRFEVETL